MKVYKLQDLKSGLYHSSGTKLSKLGKCWSRITDVKNHINTILDSHGYYEDIPARVIAKNKIINETIVIEFSELGETSYLLEKLYAK